MPGTKALTLFVWATKAKRSTEEADALLAALTTSFEFNVLGFTASTELILPELFDLTADSVSAVMLAVEAAMKELDVTRDTHRLVLTTEYLAHTERGLPMSEGAVARLLRGEADRKVGRPMDVASRAREVRPCRETSDCPGGRVQVVLSPELRELSDESGLVYVTFARSPGIEGGEVDHGTFLVYLAREGRAWTVSRITRFHT
jgi:hypothetical protein